jgi:hypothetical protein
MDVSPAETELIDLIRGGTANAFTLTIMVEDGRWTVATQSAGGYAVGKNVIRQ